MKIRVALLAAGLMTAAPSFAGADTEALSADARGIVKGFFTNLKGELQAGMKSGGPVHAVEVCNIKAPAIAADASKISGWEVGRTSLRLRNPDNAPDAWEQKILEWFEALREEGQDPATMEYAEVRDTADGRVFRYMKAIPQGEVCMVCHGGESVPPEVEAKIARLYPQDEARGYAPGDIRGAFTLSRQLAK